MVAPEPRSTQGFGSTSGSPTTFNTITPVQVLTLLLTAESFMFAGFNVVVLLTSPVSGGRNISAKAAWRVALAVAVTLLAVAAGAFLAWWQVFAEDWPSGRIRQAQAIAVAIAIVVQSLIALVTTYASKR